MNVYTVHQGLYFHHKIKKKLQTKGQRDRLETLDLELEKISLQKVKTKLKVSPPPESQRHGFPVLTEVNPNFTSTGPGLNRSVLIKD